MNSETVLNKISLFTDNLIEDLKTFNMSYVEDIKNKGIDFSGMDPEYLILGYYVTHKGININKNRFDLCVNKYGNPCSLLRYCEFSIQYL